MTREQTWATVIADASYCPKTGAAGWAVWVRTDNHPVVKKSGTFKVRPMKPSQAELWAAYNGLHIAHMIGVDDAHIVSCLEAYS